MRDFDPKQFQKNIIQTLFVIIAAILVFAIWNQLIPKAQPILEPTSATATNEDQKTRLHYVAIGDSLTEGIGDQTKRGGFVPIVADDLRERYKLTSVEVDNYGVAGDRSDQILKRMKKAKVQNNLKDADLITLTVGGNDLMKVIQDNFFGLTLKSFNSPREKYAKRVQEIIDNIREVNQAAPIYVLGIYNPFYLNFPQLKDMQKVVDQWNESTKEMVEANAKAHFIPINELLYQGIGEQAGVESDLTSSEKAEIDTTDSSDLNTVDNNVLSDGDKFHPNNTGYQLMASAVKTEIIKTQDEWLKE